MGVGARERVGMCEARGPVRAVVNHSDFFFVRFHSFRFTHCSRCFRLSKRYEPEQHSPARPRVCRHQVEASAYANALVEGRLAIRSKLLLVPMRSSKAGLHAAQTLPVPVSQRTPHIRLLRV